MIKAVVLIATVLNFLPATTKAYSVLTHEAIVDASWEKSIQPLLLKKYPGATADELNDARAYVYGGAIMPDMGYYPFGNKFFTDLVHYVRSGDFVTALLEESQDLNEYAFAVGALCHYNADKYGHMIGVNRSAPLIYPDVKEKYGDVVTYAEDKTSHLRTEFGFDVLQTARGNYLPTSYHNFIGFEIAKPVLQRAFMKVYGLDIDDVFGNFSLSVSTFRFAVKDLFPEITKAAWASKKSDIKKTNPASTRRSYIYKMRTSAYNKQFGKERTKPGFFAGILGFVIKISPKIGPLKAMKFKPPTPDAEKLFTESFDTVIVHYSGSLHQLDADDFFFTNIDFDTGSKTALGEYPLTDKTYEELVIRLKEKNFSHLNTPLKENILTFYSSNDASTSPTGTDGQDKQKFDEALASLKNAQTQ